jgi:hypothetical protein
MRKTHLEICWGLNMEDGRKNPGFSSIYNLTKPIGDTFPRPPKPPGGLFSISFPHPGGGERGRRGRSSLSMSKCRGAHTSFTASSDKWKKSVPTLLTQLGTGWAGLPCQQLGPRAALLTQVATRGRGCLANSRGRGLPC